MEPPSEGHVGTTSVAIWTSAQSAFTLSFLANLVVNGSRTSSTYKNVHYNQCARALNEKFKTNRSGHQIKNHMKYWRTKFQKVCRLQNLSGTGWDEDTSTITLDDEHYNNHVQDHKSDAEYLNKPIEHFSEMLTIFGSSMATGKFAKDSSAPLGTEDGETEAEETEGNDKSEGAATQSNNGATSSVTRNNKRNKRAKVVDDDDGLIAAFDRASTNLANAIKEVAKSENDVPDDLFDNLMSLPGFNETHISFNYAYLVSQPHVARANKLPFNHKINWVAMFIAEKFPGQ